MEFGLAQPRMSKGVRHRIAKIVDFIITASLAVMENMQFMKKDQPLLK